MGINGYIIWDTITDQKLAYYDPLNPDKWDWDCDYFSVHDHAEPLMTKVHVFPAEYEAESALNHVEIIFKAAGEKVAFKILPVTMVTGYQIAQ